MSIISINPATGEPIAEYALMSPDETRAVVDAVHAAWLEWRLTTFADRAAVLTRAATLLRDRRHDLARLMALEMGKPLLQGAAEAEKCAWACEFYAEHAARQLADEVVATDASRSLVAFEPLGVVLAVMPWNFPFWQVFRFAAPALMAGNAAVLKHASNVPGCALAIEALLTDAGLPANVFRTLLIGSKHVPAVIDHAFVRAVTLTGSTPAGKAVAAHAGAALKKTVLELGGSDAYLVLADADLDVAVPACVNARLINGGQSCIAAKRFIVVGAAIDEFTRRFVDLMQTKKMGDPLADLIDVGPQARVDLRDELNTQVLQSIQKGARLLLGGVVPPGPGAFYPPTVLADVGPGMPAYDDELFGPVAAILGAPDDDEAIRIANDSAFGLGAAVFSRDTARAEAVARRLEAGSVFINTNVVSDLRLPFGGIKQSGYGRELGSYGIREFVNIKTIVVK